MIEKPSGPAYTAAAVAGAVLWALTSVATGMTEPWDAPSYWTVAYPISIVLSGVLGYLFPHRPWRWALTVMLMQIPVMILGGSGFGLLPLGVILLAVLSLPAMVLAKLAAVVRLRNAS